MSEQKWVRGLGALSAIVGIGYFLFEILQSPLISEAAKYFSLTMIIFAAFAIYVQTYFRRT
ncbi:MAG: hypothetical protein FJY76_02320 [Candidatus Aenigmarchaeota archaeon]|nr:hypothetical protein [Candidatus Aenigmarchaeota archaeon]